MNQPVNSNDAGRFLPLLLEPGAPGAFACFGSWENIKACQPISTDGDAFTGCSQALECRFYTLERNPPTMRFRAKPRRDGRFEIAQFREFIGEEETYGIEVVDEQIITTYPGTRKVPKSRRFFLHTKHVQQARMDIEKDLELIISLDRMIVRQARAVNTGSAGRSASRRDEEDPLARQRRIAERLREKASADASKTDDLDDDLDIELDIEIYVDDEDIESDEGEGDESDAEVTDGKRASARVEVVSAALDGSDATGPDAAPPAKIAQSKPVATKRSTPKTAPEAESSTRSSGAKRPASKDRKSIKSK